MGEADGSIMPVIMTAHIPHSNSTCGASHRTVIIQALEPVIAPYMSLAITTIQAHETSGSRISRTIAGVRSNRNADSRIVGVRSLGSTGSDIHQLIAVKRGATQTYLSSNCVCVPISGDEEFHARTVFAAFYHFAHCCLAVTEG